MVGRYQPQPAALMAGAGWTGRPAEEVLRKLMAVHERFAGLLAQQSIAQNPNQASLLRESISGGHQQTDASGCGPVKADEKSRQLQLRRGAAGFGMVIGKNGDVLEISPDGPAAAVDWLQPGCRISAVGSTPVTSRSEIVSILKGRDEIELTVLPRPAAWKPLLTRAVLVDRAAALGWDEDMVDAAIDAYGGVGEAARYISSQRESVDISRAGTDAPRVHVMEDDDEPPPLLPQKKPALLDERQQSSTDSTSQLDKVLMAVDRDETAVPPIVATLTGAEAAKAAEMLSGGAQGLVRAGPLAKMGDVRKQVREFFLFSELLVRGLFYLQAHILHPGRRTRTNA
eukprot:SAG31_NODE_2552_length_5509_cov_3.954898_4_plen_342_part_00